MEEHEEEVERLNELLERGETGQAASRIAELGSGQAAEVITLLPAAARADVLLDLPRTSAADILEEMHDDIAAATVAVMPATDAAPIVQEMLTNQETDLLQQLTPEHAEAIVGHFDPSAATVVRELLAHDEDTAGGLMQTEYVAIREDMTASEVVELLRSRRSEYADFPAAYLYVVDADGILDGVLSMRALVLCGADDRVADIKSPKFVAVTASTEAEDLARTFRQTHYLVIPVVDDAGKLLGVVTQESAMRYVQEEAEEELLRMTGIVGGEEFRDMALTTRSWGRLSWLSVNVLLNVVAASVIALYQDTLRSVIALAVFLPIISDMSGCSGNQAVAVSIRELSLGRVQPSRILWVVGKELSVGFINGFSLGAILAAVAWFWKGSIPLGLIVGAALWVNTLVAVVVGGSVPLILKRFDRDPAIASGPILTTLTDMCGFFVVLALATRYIDLLR